MLSELIERCELITRNMIGFHRDGDRWYATAFELTVDGWVEELDAECKPINQASGKTIYEAAEKLWRTMQPKSGGMARLLKAALDDVEGRA